MDLVKELFATAVVAVLFSFIVAKLVSVAMAGDSVRDSESESGKSPVDGVPVVQDVKFKYRLSARGFDAEDRVDAVGETVGEVDRLEAEVLSADEVGEPVLRSEDIGLERGELAEKAAQAIELPEKLSEEESVRRVESATQKESECCPPEVEEEDVGGSHGGTDVDLQSHELKDMEAARVERPDDEPKQTEAERVIVNVDSDDDDWEGIEKSELEKNFDAAAKLVGPGDVDDRLEGVSSDVKMQLYGLHKLATEGPCRDPQPMALMVSARAKCDGGHCLRCARNAWQRLGNMSPEMAMEQYITLLSENIPDWEGRKATDENKLDVSKPGVHLSSISCDQLRSADLREALVSSEIVQDNLSRDDNSMNKTEE